MSRETILVVDDDLHIRILVKTFLERAGYAVVTAGDGAEGLHAYQKHQSSVSLLIADVVMPHLSGADLADRVLQFDSDLPVLFMSGDAARASFHSQCLQKPFNSADLVGKVATVLQASTRRQEDKRRSPIAPDFMASPTPPQQSEQDDGSRIHLQLTGTERRSKVRYPLALNVLYRSVGRKVESGEGQALNLSSGGALIHSDHKLQVGTELEVRIEWPSLLDGRIPLQLVALGRVVRCAESSFAVAFRRYQFRTLKNSRQPGANPNCRLNFG